MANPYRTTQNNFCYFDNHEKDATPGAPSTGRPPAWTQAGNAGVTPFAPLETPDNYDYMSFDFQSVGYVIELMNIVIWP
ncbi:MAG: hypothetical protein FWC40_06185 [Proteobacteria bacterium]|nr:hypothetical protein [Pseudomonadota bacterium]